MATEKEMLPTEILKAKIHIEKQNVFIVNMNRKQSKAFSAMVGMLRDHELVENIIIYQRQPVFDNFQDEKRFEKRATELRELSLMNNQCCVVILMLENNHLHGHLTQEFTDAIKEHIMSTFILFPLFKSKIAVYMEDKYHAKGWISSHIDTMQELIPFRPDIKHTFNDVIELIQTSVIDHELFLRKKLPERFANLQFTMAKNKEYNFSKSH
jgi:hypothetical protein